MKLLVTGGFGNIGVVTVEECLRRGHAVTVFDVRNRRTDKLARRYRARGVRVLLGDVRRESDLFPAAAGQDAVIHLAAVLPPTSDERPELCMAVNVDGTRNLLAAMGAGRAPGASLVAVSSASVMGPTQKRDPPVRPGDPPAPTDAYSRSKTEAEELVSSSGLRHCILRLAAVMPTRPPFWASRTRAALVFDMPLDARCEIVLDIDVAFALVSAAENLTESGSLAGQRLFIAGGTETGCQLRTRTLVAGLFGAMGLDSPDESLFSPDPDSYYLDWYDTEESQRTLAYQRHTFEEWKTIMGDRYRAIRPIMAPFRSGLTRIIEQQSPYIHGRRERSHS